MNTVVLEFFKNDTEVVTLKSSIFGINASCSLATCNYAVPISATPDLNVSFNGYTTVMKSVSVTATGYYAEL